LVYKKYSAGYNFVSETAVKAETSLTITFYKRKHYEKF